MLYVTNEAHTLSQDKQRLSLSVNELVKPYVANLPTGWILPFKLVLEEQVSSRLLPSRNSSACSEVRN